MPLTMLDLCSGLGGASRAMVDRGWSVVSVDNLEWLKPTVVGDVLALPLTPYPVDLLWASPPCTQYSRNDQPWFKNEPPPDQTLYRAIRQLIDLWQPRYYVIENVRGAQKWWGRATRHYSSRYLWTDIPLLPEIVGLDPRAKRRVWGQDPLAYWIRSKIPYPISWAIATTIESLS